MKFFFQYQPTRYDPQKSVQKTDNQIIISDSLSCDSAQNNNTKQISVYRKNTNPVFIISDTIQKTSYTAETSNNKFVINYIRNSVEKYYDWFMLIFIVILFVISIIKKNHAKHLQQGFKSLFNYQLANKMFRDSNRLVDSLTVLFIIINNVILSIFIFEIFQFYNYFYTKNPLYDLLYIFIYLLIIIFFRYLFLKMAGFVFLRQKDFNEYLFNVFLHNKTMGMFLFPIIAVYPFLPDIFNIPLLILGFTVIILMNVLRFYRGLKIILSKDILIYYLILYFCTFEILPLLILYKITVSLMW